MFNKPKISIYYSDKKRKANLNAIRVKVTSEIIVKILKLFNYNKVIVRTSIEKNSNLFEKFKKLDIKFTTKITKANHSNIELIFSIPSDYTTEILKDIITSNSEDIYLCNTIQDLDWDEILYNSQNIDKISNFSILISDYESVIDLTYTTEIYNPDTINDKLKQIISEN